MLYYRHAHIVAFFIIAIYFLYNWIIDVDWWKILQKSDVQGSAFQVPFLKHFSQYCWTNRLSNVWCIQNNWKRPNLLLIFNGNFRNLKGMKLWFKKYLGNLFQITFDRYFQIILDCWFSNCFWPAFFKLFLIVNF